MSVMIDSIHHACEFLLGLPRDYLQKQGEWSLQFNPPWPGQTILGTSTCNVMITVIALIVVFLAYRDDGRSMFTRIGLGAMRFLLLAFVLLLLNRPVLTLGQSRTEPSVLAIMIDDSSSMRVPDAGIAPDIQTRLSAVQKLFSDRNGELLTALSRKHNLKLYRFDRAAVPVADLPVSSASNSTLIKRISALKAEGDSTQVLPSILNVAQDLQGQRVAGVVVLTDGRDTPVHDIASDLDKLKSFGVKIYPVAVGSDQQPRNIELQSMQVDDVAFSGDVVNVRAIVRVTGYEPGHLVHLVLKDKKTNTILPGDDGKPAETDVHLADDKPTEVELHWQTSAVGNTDVEVEAVNQPGEIDETDNSRSAMISVLDARISILLVDGSPRWDYRYLKNALLRDKSVAVSCLLASADFNFLQDGNKPLPSSGKGIPGHFPETIEQLMDYDVLVIGDADPHFFSDSQLQLISEFVNRGGGFMMVAGPRWAPQAYRNTPIEGLLPITLSHVESGDPAAMITQGFRPTLTRAGKTAGIYRFFPSITANDAFLKNNLPELFWYCRGITAKPSVGEVLAEHPTDMGPDGHKAPLLVAGRFGGRTLFSAIDDSWRWRYYNDQHVFDSYWVQQLRYLARDHKINQRHLTLSTDQPVYELGAQVRLTLHVMDPALIHQLSAQIRVQIKDSSGQSLRAETLVRQEGNGGETFVGSFTADKPGKFNVQLPPIAAGVDAIESPLEVILPRMELVDPRVDRIQLSRLASETFGKPVELANAASELEAIPSAEKVMPVISGQPLWNAPLSLAIFVLLIGTEWVLRKLNGMA
jgi:uncharacterized membrane protein